MSEDKFKGKNTAIPIENHAIAAWANIEKTKTVSNVTIPSEIQVRNSKEYVDTNEK
ncbi:MAG: CDIF630_02480 family spore surface protein [Ruminiclostridium sp.]